MEKKDKFINSFVSYSTVAVIAGAIVLIETVPGFKSDDKNQFYVKVDVEPKKNINLELKELNEFDYIEISTLDGKVKIDTNNIDKITYLNNNEEIVISMNSSVKYYTGVFDYDNECYIFEERLCKYSKNEIHQYVLNRTNKY